MKEKLKRAASATGEFLWEILGACWEGLVWLVTLEWMEDML